MRVYLASRFGRRYELRKYRQDLEGLGHIVTSRWLDAGSEDPEALGLCAQEDLIDIITADVIVNFTEPARGNSRGGRHCEFGIGLALGKRLAIVGPLEHAFHHLVPQDARYASWQEFRGTGAVLR
jgi:hypothetical protein